MDDQKPQADISKIKSAASLMADTKEIAAYAGISEEDLREYYWEDVQEGWRLGKIQLRQLQFNSARSGDTEMLKWLGQQYLGQTNNKS